MMQQQQRARSQLQQQQQQQRSSAASSAWMQGPSSSPSGSDLPSSALQSVRFAYGSHQHSLLLSPDLSAAEAQSILRAVFKLKENVVGIFEPTRQIIFPFSLLTVCPSAFTDTYWLVLEHSGMQQPQQQESQQSPADSASSSPRFEPQQQPQRAYAAAPRVRTGAQQAFNKARDLARLASASPLASSPEASDIDPSDIEPSESERSFDGEDDEEEEEDDHRAEEDEEWSEGSERSDQRERDQDADDAAFDLAVERAMAAAEASKQKRVASAPQPRSQVPAASAKASAARQQQQQGQQQRLAQQQQQQQQLKQQQQSRSSRLPTAPSESDESDSELEERLLRELGEYDMRGDGGGVEGEEADALRQQFWERERERHWIEAEQKVLKEEAQKLAAQRRQIEELQAQQKRLQDQQAAAIAQIRVKAAEHDAAARAAAAAAKRQVNAATALKSAMNGRQNNGQQQQSAYNTFDSEGSEDDDAEDEEDQEDQEEEDEEEEDDSRDLPSSYGPASASVAAGAFVLSESELRELDELQVKTGFASVSPAQLFHLFRRRLAEPKAGSRSVPTLTRVQFEHAAGEFVRLAGLESDAAASRKAVLVLSRLFDLFDESRTGRVPFASFATGLAILCQGDSDQRVLLALSNFAEGAGPHSAGALSLAGVAAYFTAFFTVVFDLSVSLQSNVLGGAAGVGTSVDELANATARKLFADLAVEPSQGRISFAQFRDWYNGLQAQQAGRQQQGAAGAMMMSPGGRIVQDSEEEEEEEEGEDEEEEEEDAESDEDGSEEEARQEEAIQRAMEAAVEAQYRGMLMQRQLEEERAATVQHNRANKQRLQQQQQQQQSRPRAQL